MEERHHIVKTNIHKLLTKHNQIQASNLLMFAQSLETFFDIKIHYKNPYSNENPHAKDLGKMLELIFNPRNDENDSHNSNLNNQNGQ